MLDDIKYSLKRTLDNFYEPYVLTSPTTSIATWNTELMSRTTKTDGSRYDEFQCDCMKYIYDAMMEENRKNPQRLSGPFLCEICSKFLISTKSSVHEKHTAFYTKVVD